MSDSHDLSGILILIEDVPLHIDVTCYRCKRLVALSNCEQIDGRLYCFRCAEEKLPLGLLIRQLTSK